MNKRNKKLKKNRSTFNLSLKRGFILSSLIIVGFFGLLALFGKNGLLDSMKLKKRIHQLNQENQALLTQQKELKREIQALKEPSIVEYLAREKLGLMKEDEIFLILDNNKK